jgi:signal transduction histidine kinase
MIGLLGTRRSLETTAVPLPTADGFTHLGITRDVTARKLQERALADSRARLDYAVRASGVGFWSCGLPFAELDWDERVKAHFWLPPDARVTIDAFYERLHPDDREPARGAIDRSIGERSTYAIDYRTVNPTDGRIKWIRALGGASYVPDGTPTRFDGVTLDVTDRKLEERRQTLVLEQIAEAALAIHASGSLDNVLHVFTDRARRILHASEAVTRLAPTESQPGLEVRSTADEGPGRADRRQEVALVGRTGAILGTVEIALDPDGAFAACSEAILIQLAQVATVAIDNALLYDQLLEQDHRKNEFLATLAHELRNPLAPIRTGLRILGIAISGEQAAATREMMERQVAHMVRMVDDLLDLSRITRGKVTLKPERVDFRTVLDAALETSRPAIESGGHEIAIRMPRDALPLEVDPTRLAQVLANLLNNSAKYTPEGGRIQVAADREGARLVVRVTDSGVGMPVDMLPQVFEMFTQVGRSIDRSQGGLGIGLTLVRRLVEMHGGSVEAHSDGPGTGSTFTVRLPLAPRAPSRPSQGTSPASIGAARSRILVVDDNVDAAATLATMLTFDGHEIALAHTGPEALEIAGPFRPDVVLLDIGLPGMNGYEVARRLARPEGPVLIAITGWGGEEDRKQAHAAGFHHHLVKPVDPDELSALLADVRSA